MRLRILVLATFMSEAHEQVAEVGSAARSGRHLVGQARLRITMTYARRAAGTVLSARCVEKKLFTCPGIAGPPTTATSGRDRPLVNETAVRSAVCWFAFGSVEPRSKACAAPDRPTQ